MANMLVWCSSQNFCGCLLVYIIIIIMFVSLARVCIVYVVKEVASFRGGGVGQLIGVARNRTHAQALQTSRKKAACSFT